MAVIHLAPRDLPSRLYALSPRPRDIWVSRRLDESRAIAIVGSRETNDRAMQLAGSIAAAVTATGAVVVSGGARGIDRAAHEGALNAGGRTWCVQPCGHLRTSPTDNEDLFERIRASDGALVWPFRPDTKPMNGHFLRRNRFLVALSEAVVIVDAGFPSGTLNAAKWATDLGRPVYAVPPEWGAGKESGLLVAIERGARPLWSIQTLLTEMRLVATDEPPTDEVEPEEKEVLAAVLSTPEHVDSIAFRAGLTAELVATSLLTLSLKNVVVEGPPGFFRRAFAS